MIDRNRLRHLAESAVIAILHRTSVSVTRDANCAREGFPLPIAAARYAWVVSGG